MQANSRIVCLIAIPTLKVPFCEFFETQVMPGFADQIARDRPVLVLESEKHLNAVYSLIIPMISHQSATKFYSAFNGRYFRDDVETIL